MGWSAGGRRVWAALGALLIVALLGACGGQAPTATPRPTASATAAPARPTVGTPASVTTLARVATAPGTARVTTPGTPVVVATLAPATPPAPPAAPTATPLVIPPAAAPDGWPVYTGQALPFTMAYPPGWLADETQVSNGLVYFYAPGADRTTFVVVASTRRPETTTSLDVLRDQWFQSRTQVCLSTGIVETRREVFADTTFATVGATCDRPTLLAYIVAAVGVHDGVPWVVELNAPYDDYQDDLTRYFTPMLATLRIGQTGRRAVGQRAQISNEPAARQDADENPLPDCPTRMKRRAPLGRTIGCLVDSRRSAVLGARGAGGHTARWPGRAP